MVFAWQKARRAPTCRPVAGRLVGFPSPPAPAEHTDFPTVQVHLWVHLGTPLRHLSDGGYFSSSPPRTPPESSGLTHRITNGESSR